MGDEKKTFSSVAKALLWVGIVLIIVAALVIGWLILNSGEEGKITTVSEVSLQKVIEINELSTVDYTYNATTSKIKEGSDEVMYYVAYEGTVTAGIDFHKISFVLNEEEKTISITIPEIEIHNVSVNMGTMEYIFTKDKYETETISQEAYKLCKADLEKRVQDEQLLKDTAKENAVASVEALFKPWIDTVDEDYKVIIQ